MFIKITMDVHLAKASMKKFQIKFKLWISITIIMFYINHSKQFSTGEKLQKQVILQLLKQQNNIRPNKIISLFLTETKP